MNNEHTFNALVIRRGNDLLRARGWPDNAEVDTDARPGWVSVYARFNGDELAALLASLAGHAPQMPGELLSAAAQKVRGTDATMVIYADRYTAPEMPGSNSRINFPFAGEWLNEAELDAVRAAIGQAIRDVCRRVLDDSRRIRAAITPLPATRVLERGTRNFRLVVDECDDELWLGSDDPDNVKQVLDAVLNKGARYCALKLMIVHELTENILSYTVMPDITRLPGEAAHRWLDRDALREALTLARAEVLSILNAHHSFDNKR